jgi:hypothetical protein
MAIVRMQRALKHQIRKARNQLTDRFGTVVITGSVNDDEPRYVAHDFDMMEKPSPVIQRQFWESRL